MFYALSLRNNEKKNARGNGTPHTHEYEDRYRDMYDYGVNDQNYEEQEICNDSFDDGEKTWRTDATR